MLSEADPQERWLIVLAEEGTACARRATERMLENPFWAARFGDRASRHTHEDGLYHLAYLVQSLRLGTPGLFVEYARWLRSVLVPRGMCTRHLADHFRVFAEELTKAELVGHEQAAKILQASARALRDRDGVAGAIERCAEEVAHEVTARLHDAHPEWFAREGARARCADDLSLHLSYLADAAELARPELFAAYLDFIRSFLDRLGVPAGHLRESLVVLADRLQARLSVDEWRALAPMLEKDA